MIDAANIQANDTVAGIDAGIGSVARNIPPVRRLFLVELDERLAEILRNELVQVGKTLLPIVKTLSGGLRAIISIFSSQTCHHV